MSSLRALPSALRQVPATSDGRDPLIKLVMQLPMQLPPNSALSSTCRTNHGVSAAQASTVRRFAVVTVAAALTALCSPHDTAAHAHPVTARMGLHQAPIENTVRLSDGAQKVVQALAASENSQPWTILIDTKDLDARECVDLLHALDDRRREGKKTFAVIGEVEAGSAIFALACDALIALPGASLTGATNIWCASGSARDQFAEELEELGYIDPLLATRLVGDGGALSWKQGAGYRPDGSGTVKIAASLQPARLSEAQLGQLGLLGGSYATLDLANAAVAANRVKVRQATAVASAASSAPAVPQPPSAAPQTPSNRPGVPAASTPAVPALDPEVQARLNSKLKDYKETLADCIAKLKTFDGYFEGRSGIWTPPNDSLKEVWQAKSGNTKHSDTKLQCERLQREIKLKLTQLATMTRTIEKIAAQPEHPDVVRTKANLEPLQGLHGALDDNKVDDYEKFAPLVEKLK
jgi:hypothetical protein